MILLWKKILFFLGVIEADPEGKPEFKYDKVQYEQWQNQAKGDE